MNDQSKNSGMRAGAEALSLLAAPLNIRILEALKDGPRELTDLRKAIESVPQSTFRLYSRKLKTRGIIECPRRRKFPSAADYNITPVGKDLLAVAEALRKWLEVAPDGPMELGTLRSRSATKALVEGWSNNIVRAVAIRPLTLVELNRLIPALGYPALERRVTALREAGLLAPFEREGCRGTPYVASEWLRRAVIPLAAGAGWEHRYPCEEAQPLGRLDVEAGFLLAVPLLQMPPTLSGKCRLVVEFEQGDSRLSAGVVVGFEGGRPISCTCRLEGEVDAWAAGSPEAWTRRMSGVGGSLDIGGDPDTAGTVLNGLAAMAQLPPLAPESPTPSDSCQPTD